MVDLSKLHVDADLEKDGKWFTFVHDVELKIARINNDSYNKHIRKLSKKFTKGGFRVDKIPDDVMIDISLRAMAIHVLKDWKNLEENGKPIEYSPENSYRILSDPACRIIKDFVKQEADDDDNFLKEALEEEAKNSLNA